MLFLPLVLIVMETGSVGSQIISGPTIQNISVGDVAVFNCSLQCTKAPMSMTITWYVVMPATLQKVSIFPYTSLNQVKTVYGLDVSRNIIDECSKGGYRVEQLLMSNVTKAFDLMPVQCGLLCFPGSFGCTVAQILFSPVGVVKIVPKDTPPASTPPASTPPTSTPPASTPPTSTPPASTPPTSTPPVSTRPASTPGMN